MTSQLPCFWWVYLLLIAEKKTTKTGQLWHHQGSSYFVTALVKNSSSSQLDFFFQFFISFNSTNVSSESWPGRVSNISIHCKNSRILFITSLLRSDAKNLTMEEILLQVFIKIVTESKCTIQLRQFIIGLISLYCAVCSLFKFVNL